MKLGHLSIDAYFCKIESNPTILASLGSPISKDDIVNIALDGLSEKYDHVSDIIIHREPFSDLKMVYSMLTMMEIKLKSWAQVTILDSLSSSPMVLLANSVNNNARRTAGTPGPSRPVRCSGPVSRYKARFVTNGSTQLSGVDFDETFSMVVKPSTIRIILSLAISRPWLVHQLDVKNAFFHGDLSKTSLYGLKHAPRAWFSPLLLILLGLGLVMVIITTLHQEFSITDLGSLNYFLVIFVTRDSSGMFLSQRKYANKILERAHMVGCNSCRTLVDTESKLGDDEYRGVVNVVAETCWLRNLLREFHTPLSSATLVYYDNVSAVYLSFNLYADIFTKGLPSALFEEFRTSLSIWCPPTPTARQC
uniref:Reverse transcriptase Ty1/copia-type domain-containing protein n=1 Tax=Tanacetum cinerariifolium TaxID=118510 RepID=A0A699HPD4_TANCI|nr:hypothetical protein [Tanacetum cinerariifolium]